MSTALETRKIKEAAPKRGRLRNRFELLDAVILVILVLWALIIVLPFISVIGASFSTPQEYQQAPLMLFPRNPTLENYNMLFAEGRILIGYKTTLIFLTIGVPINMFLTTSIAYALSRPDFPFKKFFLYAYFL